MAVSADVFGLWDSPELPAPGELSFSAPGMDQSAGSPAPVSIWSVDLAAGPAELERRAAQVQAIESGLADAGVRLDAFLARREAVRRLGGASYDLSTAPAEASLSAYLDDLEPQSEPSSFGIGDAAARLAGQVRGLFGRSPGAAVPWQDLRARLEALLESVDQQVLHFAWVESKADQRLLARTAVRWGGDMTTSWQNNLPAEVVQAHHRSLELALASRAANMRAFLVVTQLAGKIALAAATPLGPLQALSMAWQFVQEVVLPLMEQANNENK